MIFCISVSWSLPKPFSARPCNSLARVSGSHHRERSSASSLKKSGSLPKSNSMNCWADIGVPSGCQNVVTIMCWIVRALPSASLTLIFVFFLQTQASFPQTGQGSLAHSHGLLPQTEQGCGGFSSQTQGRLPHLEHGSGSNGSPS